MGEKDQGDHPLPPAPRPRCASSTRAHPTSLAPPCPRRQDAAIKAARLRKKQGLPPLDPNARNLKSIWDCFGLMETAVYPMVAVLVGRLLLEHLKNITAAVRSMSLRPGYSKHWTTARKQLYAVLLGPNGGTNTNWELKHMLLAVVVVASMALGASWCKLAEEDAAREAAEEEAEEAAETKAAEGKKDN